MPYFPYFRNHAPRCSTGLFHGTGRSIQTSMALPCMPCICLPCVCIALSCLVLVCVLPCPCMYCLVFSGSEDAVSGASLRTLLAPPWAPILLGIRCFATMPHRAPQGFSMVLAGPSRQLWLCLLCLLCLAYAFCLAVPKMLFRHPLCARFWHRLGLQSCWGSGVSQPCPTVLHRAFPWYWPVHPDSYGFAFICLLCLAYAFCLAVPKMLFRHPLCARFWHRLGLQSCWGSGVSQPCPTVLHRAFPWYWPVHPDSYGFAFYAFYALHMPSVLLYLSSDLGVVCLFRRSCIFAIVQARLRHVFGLCTGALFFFLGGSKGAVLDPPNVLFFAVPELGFRWCLAVSDPLVRSCIFAIVQARLRHVFGLRTGAKGAALDPPNSSYRGFQRCCFGPAEGTVFCCA